MGKLPQTATPSGKPATLGMGQEPDTRGSGYLSVGLLNAIVRRQQASRLSSDGGVCTN